MSWGHREFRSFMEEHERFVSRLVRWSALPADRQQDVMQEIWWTVSRRLDDVLQHSNPRGWLAAVANHHIAHNRRGFARLVRKVGALQTIAETSHNPYGRVESASCLKYLVESMPEKLREVYVMIELSGLTAQEAADVLSISANTASSRLRLARSHVMRTAAVLSTTLSMFASSENSARAAELVRMELEEAESLTGGGLELVVSRGPRWTVCRLLLHCRLPLRALAFALAFVLGASGALRAGDRAAEIPRSSSGGMMPSKLVAQRDRSHELGGVSRRSREDDAPGARFPHLGDPLEESRAVQSTSEEAANPAPKRAPDRKKSSSTGTKGASRAAGGSLSESVPPKGASPFVPPSSLNFRQGVPPDPAGSASRSKQRGVRPTEQPRAALPGDRWLLDRGEMAILRGNLDWGIRRLERHEHKFPDSPNRSVREQLMIRALCKQGSPEEARRRALTFNSLYPDNHVFKSAIDQDRCW